ncbi:hypothetical protein EDC94DRAFT_649217 [Helicostylum pulchrum]|nr:hypothetical protein EDC94DRAFT_649217 [Helicostylum pulchrum]
MNTLQNRIGSFKNNSVKWPYMNNSKYCKTETFAKAGFYFVGKPNARDSVRCFLCDIELSIWKPKQSPFLRHGNESPHCAWTRLNFPDTRKRPLSGPIKAFDTPRSIRMRSARLATFNCNKYWTPKRGDAKYPSATKLANAGFYFSPTANAPSRVKCAYCGESVTVNPDNTDFLNKHRNLSIDCAFFEESYSTRSSISSTKSRESRAKGDELNSDSSTCKRPINVVSTSSETNTPIFKRPKALDPVAIKKCTSGKDSAGTNMAEGVQKASNKTDDSIWDFNQVLTPPKRTCRTMITYGSSRPVHHVPRSTRNNPGSVNILPDLTSSLIIKPDGPYIDSPATQPINNTKKAPQASTKSKVIRIRRLQKPKASGSGTSVPPANPPRKRSLSISSVIDSTAPPTKKPASTPEYYQPSGPPPRKPIPVSRYPTMLLLQPFAPSFPEEDDYMPAAEGSGTFHQPLAHTEPAYGYLDTPPISYSPVPEYASIYDDEPEYYPLSPQIQKSNYSPEPASLYSYTSSPHRQDLQEVLLCYVDPDTPISHDTEEEWRHVLNPPSPVYTHEEHVDRENILPRISYSPEPVSVFSYDAQLSKE